MHPSTGGGLRATFPAMDDQQFDHALIGAVFSQAALRGWRDVNIAEAARDADLPLDRARARFPGRGAVLLRFGVAADQAALVAGSTEPSPRERLFDMVMSRFDALQQHRAAILQLLRALRTDPATSLLLYGATLRSMKWLLDGAGIPSSGVVGALRVHGLLALWLYALRIWETDESTDLSATMAAVDRGLDRAVQAENMLPGRSMSPAEDAASVFTDAGAIPDEPLPEPDLSDPAPPEPGAPEPGAPELGLSKPGPPDLDPPPAAPPG